jgi:hypothetical protein
VSLVLLFVGTFLLRNAVSSHPDLLNLYVRFTVLGLSETAYPSGLETLLSVVGVTGWLVGVTLLARLPRLASGFRWYCWGAIAFLAGCLSYYLLSARPEPKIGQAFRGFGDLWATFDIFLLSLLVGLVSLVVMMPTHKFDRARRDRWFRKGMRPLIFFGATTIFLIGVASMLPHSALTAQERANLSRNEVSLIDRAHLNRLDLNVLLWPRGRFENPGLRVVVTVTQLLQSHPSIWPVLLSGAAFLYLWWLAALIFDFGFIWQRYVRNSLALRQLMNWSEYRTNPPQTTKQQP